jgi:branched-chain amino acid transport system ATP-binding protein
MNMAQPLLATNRLSVFYDQLQAVREVDLTIDAGEIVSIIGANGAGKSSFLRAVIGQAPGHRGQVFSRGRDLSLLPTAKIVAHGVALVPEGRKLFPSLTVVENLRIGWELGRRGDIDIAQIYAWFPALQDLKDRLARSLSGGQQQMVALGRALLTNPRLLLCDEISLGLAPLIVDQLYDILLSIKSRGIGIVIVEQDVNRALAISDRFYCFLEGKVSLSGRPSETSRDIVMQHYFGI